jgi:hypothetical protein
MPTLSRRALLAAFAALPLLPRRLRAQGDRPVVVELFTSQGCSSCPPADALLGELAAREDVIALAYHVDYWDYIGWRDRFGDPANTQRQRTYAAWMGTRMVYTPQMVVAGRYDVVGSRRQQVEDTLALAHAEPPPLAVSMLGFDRVAIAGPPGPADALVLAVIFQARAETPVGAGENGGSTLVEYNIVREMIPVGHYGGGTQELTLDSRWLAEEDYDGCAILVQDAATGRILGAARMLK